MSRKLAEQEISMRNYNILNTIILPYHKKKFPYDILQNFNNPNLELTHKKLNLFLMKDKKYFVEEKNINNKKIGSSEKIMVYLL